MTIVDHLFFLFLAVVYPITSFFSFRRLVRRIETGELIGPTKIYNSTLMGHWAMFAAGLAIWLFAGRSWGALGFDWNVDTGFLIGLALSAAAIVILVWQYGSLGNASEKTQRSLLRQLGDLEILMPRNNNELRRFYAVSASAGVVEETLWRGYMFWYLGHVMPLWAAAVVTSVVFGLGHVYQGVANVPKIILVGGVFAGLYLLTGSLWLPILLHAVFDAVQGRAFYTILSSGAQPQPTPAR